MLRDLVGLRVVAVHAHPDDETIWTGGALADFSQRGADVTVITCTLGEQGEVIGEPFAQLVADGADQLGGFRIGELAASLAALGVRGEFLGGAGQWRDSGMIGDAANDNPRSFIHSGPAAEAQLTEVFNRLQPHLVITYGPDGGYGHPDHIRAHEITHRAASQAQQPPQRILWAVTSAPALAEGLADIATIPHAWRRPQEGELAAVDKHDATLHLSDAAAAAKLRAMKAHPTQLWIADGDVNAVNPEAALATLSSTEVAFAVFALSNLIAQPLLRTEHYQLGAGTAIADVNSLTAGLSW
ncbi:1D-myo-inositol 2-acetamido-2-deoxy-alpha-D-glucopyranoside deacetylase [Corynebacterium kalinowskii]|uniref:1D-myo-inositol 2-acetamido-2-deoxy-alpha-D-glucopyranoside deacetylase n=1 Tax=Corynebacterium kalinowskii TaxID=2675216 RepID=A0A6B8W4T4_9CORY|nr:N-acetyl-1-D-myo-inositol-2-amino-2-deoxy-alpha-D-glucopyranoside deacetylase [Corynebacterium kalinowskii]QGU02408.1 1D-myo-inositol 2-acetamido-2-deoxy-alpha-D-glucopyranoside deacetylase [Corynebacterium kalinowskii]